MADDTSDTSNIGYYYGGGQAYTGNPYTIGPDSGDGGFGGYVPYTGDPTSATPASLWSSAGYAPNGIDVTNINAYDTSKYSSPMLAYLDNLGGQNGQTSKGLAPLISQLGLDPQAVSSGITNWSGQNSSNNINWLGSPVAYLQAAAEGDPSLAGIINPYVAQNQGQFNQGQSETALATQLQHSPQSMHGTDYAQMAAGIASILSMGYAGGAFAAGGAAGDGMAAGATGAFDTGGASGAGLLDTGATGAGTGAGATGAFDMGGSTGAGLGVGEGSGAAGSTAGEGATGAFDMGGANGSGLLGEGGSLPSQAAPQTLSDIGNFNSGDFDWTQQPQLEGGASTGQIAPNTGQIPVSDTSGYNSGDFDYSQGPTNPTDDSPLGQGAYNGDPTSSSQSLWDQIKNGYKDVSNFTKTPYYQVPKTLMDVYGQMQNANAAKAAQQRYNQQSDPFGAQRAQYQSMLQQSYADPTSLYNSPQYQSLRDIFNKQIAAKDAASGRNSQYGARSLAEQDNFNQYLTQYRAGLQQAAGTGIAPNMSGLGQIYGAAGNANKGILTSLANPSLWQSIFS